MMLALSISDLYSSSVQLLMLSSIHDADEDVERMSRDELRFGQSTRSLEDEVPEFWQYVLPSAPKPHSVTG